MKVKSCVLPLGQRWFLPLIAALAISCTPAPPASDGLIRLVDQFPTAKLQPATAKEERVELGQAWRFDETTASGDTQGWQALSGLEGFAAHDGALHGRTTSPFPTLYVKPALDSEQRDLLHAIEVRMRASAGTELRISLQGIPESDPQKVAAFANTMPWFYNSPIEAGDEMRTYTLRSPFPNWSSDIRHLLLRPTDAADAEFEIESVRFVFLRDHLASLPSGISWQGLGGIFRESIVSRSGEHIEYPLMLPSAPQLRLALGTPESVPVTFRLTLSEDDGTGEETNILERTITTAHRWDEATVDLAPYAGRAVHLNLTLEAEQPGAVGFWGTPTIRSAEQTVAVEATPALENEPPRGVVVIVTDTLRADHLDSYGYARETAPALARLAAEGVLFEDCVAQATWTKVSMSAIFSSMYSRSNGVSQIRDRLPASAVTLAEHFRDTGYTTLAFSSNVFLGAFTNLHQGFEVFHESASLPDQHTSKTARTFTDRLLPWLEEHRDVPFFVLLHIFDPHSPYPPPHPFDTRWATAEQRRTYENEAETVRQLSKEPIPPGFAMATREDLLAADIDPETHVAIEKSLYDGSIRSMDVEVGRVLEALRNLGLEDETLVVAMSDHGEEFLEHGRHFHGQSVYGELTRVPLIMRWPGVLPAGVRVAETVQTIDMMPTVLTLSGLSPTDNAQGQSLLPLIDGIEAPGSWQRRPAITEKADTSGNTFTPPPQDTEAASLVFDGWKLIHNTKRHEGKPEYELFQHREDPLNLVDVSAEHPEVVARLAPLLDRWRQQAEAERLSTDEEASSNMSAEDMERLRSLGYIQ